MQTEELKIHKFFINTENINIFTCTIKKGEQIMTWGI